MSFNLFVSVIVLVGATMTTHAAAQGIETKALILAQHAASSSASSLPSAGARTSAQIFFSGHSLIDNPLPEQVAAIAQSLGTQVLWNQQNIPGSTLQFRTRGAGRHTNGFPGYSTGKNRTGSGMNVVNELRQPQTIGGRRYDTLVITERHDIVSTLWAEDTMPYLRHFHERLIDGNPQANTYLYHSWLGMPDKNAPANWAAYERAAALAWQCTASRINQSLKHEGRTDRVIYLPAGLALVNLVEQATRGPGIDGVTGASVRATVDRIFSDDVHLTPLGVYYMALVTYASIYQRSPVGAWAPPGISKTQAQSLQTLAWQTVANHFNGFESPDLGQCRAAMRDTVCPAFLNFTRRADQIGNCTRFFTGTTQENPFFFNAPTDGNYWLPAR